MREVYPGGVTTVCQ